MVWWAIICWTGASVQYCPLIQHFPLPVIQLGMEQKPRKEFLAMLSKRFHINEFAPHGVGYKQTQDEVVHNIVMRLLPSTMWGRQASTQHSQSRQPSRDGPQALSRTSSGSDCELTSPRANPGLIPDPPVQLIALPHIVSSRADV